MVSQATRYHVMTEDRIHPESIRTLRQLIKTHGADMVRSAISQIVAEMEAEGKPTRTLLADPNKIGPNDEIGRD